MHNVDQLIHRLAAERDNVVERGEVLALGASDRFIANRLARGWWQQLHPGVYLVGAGAAPVGTGGTGRRFRRRRGHLSFPSGSTEALGPRRHRQRTGRGHRAP